jgi:hypothetical protein
LWICYRYYTVETCDAPASLYIFTDDSYCQPYSDFSGSYTISCNGTTQIVTNFTDLACTVLSDVTVSPLIYDCEYDYIFGLYTSTVCISSSGVTTLSPTAKPVEVNSGYFIQYQYQYNFTSSADQCVGPYSYTAFALGICYLYYGLYAVQIGELDLSQNTLSLTQTVYVDSDCSFELYDFFVGEYSLGSCDKSFGTVSLYNESLPMNQGGELMG